MAGTSSWADAGDYDDYYYAEAATGMLPDCHTEVAIAPLPDQPGKTSGPCKTTWTNKTVGLNKIIWSKATGPGKTTRPGKTTWPGAVPMQTLRKWFFFVNPTTICEMTFDAAGSRAVQFVMENVSKEEVERLTLPLHSEVRRMYPNPHANHVLRWMVSFLPLAACIDIVKELEGDGLEVTCHEYGCRIVLPLVERFSSLKGFPFIKGVLSALNRRVNLKSAVDLMTHEYAHHVVEAILEHGTGRQKHAVGRTLLATPVGCGAPGIVEYAADKFGSRVAEKALVCCPQRKALATAVISGGKPKLKSKGHSIVVKIARAVLDREFVTADIATKVLNSRRAVKYIASEFAAEDV